MLQYVKEINIEYNSSPSSSLSYDNFSQLSATPTSSRGYSPCYSFNPVPETSPNMLYQTQTPLLNFSSSSSQNKTKNYQSAPNNSRVVINSITRLPPLQSPHHLPHLSILIIIIIQRIPKQQLISTISRTRKGK